jgi:imidazole glycerol-phosphate synthase subunit HisH
MLALLDTGYSNLKAYSNVLKFLEQDYEIVSEGNDLILDYHSCLLLPGVSNFGALASELDTRNFKCKIKDFFKAGTKIIGTCSGMQVLFQTSEESQSSSGLNLIKGAVRKFPAQNKIDINIGWRKTTSGEYFFVHGFYCSTKEILDMVEYSNFNGIKLISEFRHGNVYGFQYHPEKSGINGVRRLQFVIDNEV